MELVNLHCQRHDVIVVVVVRVSFLMSPINPYLEEHVFLLSSAFLLPLCIQFHLYAFVFVSFVRNYFC